jgi:hypothetical protein
MPARQCVRVRRQQAEGAPCRFGGRGQQGDQRPGHSRDDPQRLPQIRPEARRRTRSGRSAGGGCPHHGLHADRRGEPPGRCGGDGGAVFTGWWSTASCSAPAPAPARGARGVTCPGSTRTGRPHITGTAAGRWPGPGRRSWTGYGPAEGRPPWTGDATCARPPSTSPRSGYGYETPIQMIYGTRTRSQTGTVVPASLDARHIGSA